MKKHEEIVNDHAFSMVPVAGGRFLMGSPEADKEAYSAEAPQHVVAVPTFRIGQFPVTQALWKAVTNGENPSRFLGDDRPVEQVSWDDVQIFIEKLNRLTQKTLPEGHVYRLPTEAEWEYAARGGSESKGFPYAGGDRAKNFGWYEENSGAATQPVGLKYPNELGLYDMSGNVWEWCEDDWDINYQGAPADGAACVDYPERAMSRVIRGGSWQLETRQMRVSNRGSALASAFRDYLGFRLVLARRWRRIDDGLGAHFSNPATLPAVISGVTFTAPARDAGMWKLRKSTLLAMLDTAEIVPYDGYTRECLEEGMEAYKKEGWTYLGSGRVYSVNGLLSPDVQEKAHFFKRIWV